MRALLKRFHPLKLGPLHRTVALFKKQIYPGRYDSTSVHLIRAAWPYASGLWK
jgi:hypothetical protein